MGAQVARQGTVTAYVHAIRYTPTRGPNEPPPVATVAAGRRLSLAELQEHIVSVTQSDILDYEVSELDLAAYDATPVDSATGVAAIRTRFERCSRCHLAAIRGLHVICRGEPDSKVVVFGEAPGPDEDIDGRPFVGRSGRLQDTIFRDFNVQPDSFFWMNAIGCLPRDTFTERFREPSNIEKLACSERTFGLFAAVRPRVVLCLGQTAAQWFSPTGAPLPLNRWMTLQSKAAPKDWVSVVHVRHPSYFLRDGKILTKDGYREYVGQRARIAELLEQLPQLTKVSRWRYRPSALFQELDEQVALADGSLYAGPFLP